MLIRARGERATFACTVYETASSFKRKVDVIVHSPLHSYPGVLSLGYSVLFHIAKCRS